MGFESVNSGLSDSDMNKWNERGRREQGDFAATVMRGDLSPDSALQMQRENTGTVIQMKGIEEGGWVVSTPAGNRNFDNLGSVLEWTRKTGGLVYGMDNNPNPIAGEPVDSILERRAKFQRFDEEHK